jgi:hypothetical protein
MSLFNKNYNENNIFNKTISGDGTTDLTTIQTQVDNNTNDITSLKTRITDNNVEIGHLAGQNSNSTYSIAIGHEAGRHQQKDNAISIGQQSGFTNQGTYSISIGYHSGYRNQNINSIAIGNSSGYTNQGQYSIAIGNQAGQTNQASQSICLNASTTALSAPTSGTFVNPIRNDNTPSSILYYNTSSSEISYGFPQSEILLFHSQFIRGTTNDTVSTAKIYTNTGSYVRPILYPSSYTSLLGTTVGNDTINVYYNGTNRGNLSCPYTTSFICPYNGHYIFKFGGWKCGPGDAKTRVIVNRSSTNIYNRYINNTRSDCDMFVGIHYVFNLQVGDVVEFGVGENNTITPLEFGDISSSHTKHSGLTIYYIRS